MYNLTVATNEQNTIYIKLRSIFFTSVNKQMKSTLLFVALKEQMKC